MTDDDDLFGFEPDEMASTTVLVEQEPEEKAPPKRSKRAFKEATVRPPTLSEALADAGDEDGLFGGVAEKPDLRDVYPDMAKLREIQGTNGLKAVSLFTGCGGSATGFALAGFEELMAVEFVKAARETYAANYRSYMVNPEDLVPDVENWIAQDTSGLRVEMNKAKRSRGAVIPPSVDWESTLTNAANHARETGDVSQMEAVDSLRYTTTKAALTRALAEGGTVLWGDDIRGLSPEAFMDVFGLKEGDLDVLEGSPPCKSFSAAGLREDGWGKVLHYSDERDQRTDDLFFEYLRILEAFKPKAFIAENVEGLTMGNAATDVLIPLQNAFAELGYTVESRVLNSEDYGVPQSRPRLFIQGISTKLIDPLTGVAALPSWPTSHPYRYTVADALEAAGESTTEEIAWAWIGTREALEAKLGGPIPPGTAWDKNRGRRTPDAVEDTEELRYGLGKIWAQLKIGASPENKAWQLIRCHPDLPSPTITATSAGNVPAAGPTHPWEPRKFTINEYRWLFSFPRDYRFTGSTDQMGERMGRSVVPALMAAISGEIAATISRCTE